MKERKARRAEGVKKEKKQWINSSSLAFKVNHQKLNDWSFETGHLASLSDHLELFSLSLSLSFSLSIPSNDPRPSSTSPKASGQLDDLNRSQAIETRVSTVRRSNE